MLRGTWNYDTSYINFIQPIFKFNNFDYKFATRHAIQSLEEFIAIFVDIPFGNQVDLIARGSVQDMQQADNIDGT